MKNSVKQKFLRIYNNFYWEINYYRTVAIKIVITTSVTSIIRIAYLLRVKVHFTIKLKVKWLNKKPIAAYGNLFLALGYVNLLNSLGGPISANLRIIAKRETETSKEVLEEILKHYKEIVEVFDIYKRKSEKGVIRFNLPPRLFWSSRMWLEHIIPSSAYDIWLHFKPKDKFRFSETLLRDSTKNLNSNYIFWSFRKNEDVRDRNSNINTFIENFHFLRRRFPRFNIVIGTSESGLLDLEHLISDHMLENCDCEIRTLLKLRILPPSVESLSMILNSEFFFSEGLHGYCDFIFFSDKDFLIRAKPFKLHPRTKEVEAGMYYPWHVGDQRVVEPIWGD